MKDKCVIILNHKLLLGKLETFLVFRKKLQQNKQSQNAASKPKVKRHRTDLDRLYVEYQVVSNPLSFRRKPKNTIVFLKSNLPGEASAKGGGGKGGGVDGEVWQGPPSHKRGDSTPAADCSK